MVEQIAVNDKVVGSNPTCGAKEKVLNGLFVLLCGS